MTTNKIKIKGMTCTGCENRITIFFKKLNGVKSVVVSLSDSSMNITYDENTLSLNDIEENIKSLGYDVNHGTEYKNNMQSKVNLILIIAIFIVLFLVIQKTIGFNFIPQINQNMSYGMLFVVGIFTSLHCVAMCGGINISQCMSLPNNNKQNKLQNLKPSFLYNSGRVVSYTIIGGIVGAIGSLLSFTGFLKGIVAVLAGLFMLIMGLKMLNIFPWLRKINLRLPIFKGIAKKLPSGPFFVGMLNGLMPCGPLQSIQIYALGTGSAIEGALSMFFFSIGTFPLMFLIGLVSSYLGATFKKNIVKFGAILVLFLGVIMINRGLMLSGVNTNFLGIVKGSQDIAVIENGVQIVKSEITSGEYPTIKVASGVPVKWVITVKDGNLNGCNNPIVLQQYNIEKELHIGENIIEFIPDKDGTFIYTCWMGMINGNIIVENKL